MRLHLLYAASGIKFFVLRDRQHERTLQEAFNQGMILGEDGEKMLVAGMF